MPKQITTGDTITLTEAKLKSLTYAYEDRGDPPVPTFVEIRTYQLLRDDGEVHEVKRTGVEVNPVVIDAPAIRWGQVQDDITAKEGL